MVFGSTIEGWELSSRLTRCGGHVGHGIYVRCATHWAICVSSESRTPMLLDPGVANGAIALIERALTSSGQRRIAPEGEAAPVVGGFLIYFAVRLHDGTRYTFVVVASHDNPCPLRYTNRKLALTLLGDMLDTLSGGTLDWTRMLIPAEPSLPPA